MRAIMTVGFALLISVSGLAQTTTATAVYQERKIVVDGLGNLGVFDSGRSTTGVTITGLRHSFYAPKTRITIQKTGSTQTVEYDGSLQVIGTSNTAVYAIATVDTVSGTTETTTQSLLAIDLGNALPPALSGFPAFPLTSPVDAIVGPNDYITLVTGQATRTATVLHFVSSGSSGSFATFSSEPLP